MKAFVTGGTGFIGSKLVDKLIERGDMVTVYDNLSSGKIEFIENHKTSKNFTFIKSDLLDFHTLSKSMKGHDIVFHLAANADIRYGTEHPRHDLEQNLLVTHNVLEAMRQNSIKKLVFSSTSAVFGAPSVIPTPEDYGPALPASLYGASKLSCEAFVSAYSNLYGIQSWIFRFANVIGQRVTHGILYDFLQKLKKNPEELEILGDGEQEKSYLYDEDCIDAMLYVTERANERISVFNIGSDDQIKVKKIARIVVEALGINPKFNFTGGSIGWKGDVSKMQLDTKKILSLGWKPKYNSEEAIRMSVRGLKELFRI
ncbi:MAG: NAD-dependent epimerase/dehydratase family protein [Candidatus Aenigmarchaeota archaeon]|nr:NAD-dependent epimerase/dehydratase family protein [Candidatus Aenigmarchaeota archaeon]